VLDEPEPEPTPRAREFFTRLNDLIAEYAGTVEDQCDILAALDEARLAWEHQWVTPWPSSPRPRPSGRWTPMRRRGT
jgi:hypothetical protein